MCRAVSSRRVLYRRCPKRSGATATSSHRTAVTPCWLAFGRRRRGSSHMKWLARRPSPPADAAKPTTAGTSLSLVVRKRHAVFHEGQGVGYLIGVYRGSIRSQRVGQTLEVVAFEEARSCRRIREAQDQRGVEPLTRRVVVRNVRGVPELLDPGQEHLGSELLQRAGAGESAGEFSDVLPEIAGAYAVPPPQVDQRSRADLLGSATSYQRDEHGGPREQRPLENVHFVLERQSGLLPPQQRRQRGLERDLRDSVDPAIDRYRRLDAAGCRPQPRVGLSEVDLPVLPEALGRRDDLRVRPLPVAHPGFPGLIGAYPEQDRGRELLARLVLRFRR